MGLPPEIILEAVLNGLLTGAVYGLVALGLTLVYGVLHIINFAHGALLTAAMYAAYVAWAALGIDPYVAALPLAALFFAIGYLVQRLVIGPASHGKDEQHPAGHARPVDHHRERCMLAVFRSDTRSIDVPYAMDVIEVGPALLSFPARRRLRRDGRRGRRAVRADALHATIGQGDPRGREGTHRGGAGRHRCRACLCRDLRHRHGLPRHRGGLLLPSFYVSPRVGNAFVLVAFTIVVLGGMGSVVGALIGGLVIGVVESLSGLFLGESLGQIGIFLIFILVLLVRPDRAVRARGREACILAFAVADRGGCRCSWRATWR